MRKASAVVSAVLLFTAVGSLRAQDVKQAVAYSALIGTPLGGLPPVLSNMLLEIPGGVAQFNARYGRLPEGDIGIALNNFAVGAELTMNPRFALGGTLGMVSPSCPDAADCKSHFMVSGGGEGLLLSSPLGDTPTSAKFTLGVNGAVGYGKPEDVNLLTFAVGVPVAIVATSGNFKIAPALIPGFGWGRISDSNDSESGTRPMLGAAVALMSTTNGFGANLGIQKTFIENGTTLFGFSLTYSPK